MRAGAVDAALAAWASAGDDPHCFVALYGCFRARMALALERAGFSPRAASAYVPRLCTELERRPAGLTPDTRLDRYVDELAATLAREGGASVARPG
jgi:hypothetical protein